MTYRRRSKSTYVVVAATLLATAAGAGASEPEAVKVIRGIYEAGFENLRRMFGP